LWKEFPPPQGDPNAPLQALIFDSVFNSLSSASLFYYRIFNGEIRKGDHCKVFQCRKRIRRGRGRCLLLERSPREVVSTGDVGYIITGIKDVGEVKVVDTITLAKNPCKESIKGFEEVKPMVFCRHLPYRLRMITNSYVEDIEKLKLNDAALTF
jgi:GTP-binding protein LepA